MPRRKRKLSGKKSLEFMESPVNNVKNLPSPVFCSDHPATADVIGCDGCHVNWVSPQFPKVPTAVGKAKYTRHSRRLAKRTYGNHSNNTTTVTPTHKTRKKIHNNIVPLRFLGDKTPEPVSPIDDISMEESDHVMTTGVRSESEKTNCRQQTLQYTLSTSNNHPPPITSKTAKKQKRKKTKPPKLKLDDLLTSDSDTSLLRDITGKVNQVTMATISGASNQVTMATVSGASNQVTMATSSEHRNQVTMTTSVHTVTNLPITPSSNDTLQESPSFYTRIKKSPRTLLFNSLSPRRHTLQKTDSNNSKQCSVNIDAERTQRGCDRTPDRTYGSLITPDRRRRSLRLLLLPNTPRIVQTDHKTHKVLVYDTPEEDYGLSVRERRIKYPPKYHLT